MVVIVKKKKYCLFSYWQLENGQMDKFFKFEFGGVIIYI